MNEEQPFISVIIPSLIINDLTRKVAILCLQTLRSFTDNYEVVMVEGNSGDFTKSIESFVRKEDNIIKNEGFVSIPRALNIGIQNAKSDYVCLIANDCIVHKDWLFNLWRAKLKSDNFFGLKNSHKFLGSHPVGMTGIEIQEWVKRDKLEENSAGIATTTFTYIGIHGCLFHKKTYEDIGVFDENLEITFWDKDYDIRSNKKGFACGVVLDSNISHIGGLTFGELESGKIKFKEMKNLDEGKYLLNKHKNHE